MIGVSVNGEIVAALRRPFYVQPTRTSEPPRGSGRAFPEQSMVCPTPPTQVPLPRWQPW